MATQQLDKDQLAASLHDSGVSIDRALDQDLLDAGIEALRADVALLQAEQERGLGSLGTTLDRIGQEVGSVRTQLAALAEPLLAAQLSAEAAAGGPGSESEQATAERDLRLERLEGQVALLVRTIETVDGLRYQSDVHTRALARLTDLLSEVIRPKPDETLESLKQTLCVVEESQRRTGRRLVLVLALFAVGAVPGLAALAWMLINSAGMM